MNQLKLKKASLDNDLETLFNICVKSFNRPFDDQAQVPDDLVKYLKNSQIYLVYKRDLPIASFSYEDPKDEAVRLVMMMVLPKYQQQGVGKFMMDKLMELIKDKKMVTVTHPKNIGAVILYLKYGFKVTGWEDDYYGDGEPRLILERS